ncbi:unnamed protein product [Notodromas monacha]|uniref:AIG1-type G domain-containing protein n=1 Tax=Notodromas monacha TaxID=399045 RepID=A0A7R9C220_9CRUS|nr:unnamed protein product [Notodromas monacha]CAG0924696.1 unnamed protein product [Notodromas monacha]
MNSYAKKIVVFGTPGTGKSSLCNVLFSGDPDNGEEIFLESPGTVSCTQDCQSEERFFLGNASRLIKIMDTPGIGDIQEKNEEQSKRLKEGLEKENNVHAFIWVKNSTNVRFDGQDQLLFNFMAEVFGSEFMTHLIVVFTRFSHSVEDIRKRSRIGPTSGSLYQGFRKELGIMADNDGISQILAVDIDAYFNPDDEYETTVFKQNCEKLWKQIQTFSLTPVNRLEITKRTYRDVCERIKSLEDKMEVLYGAELEKCQLELENLQEIQKTSGNILRRSAAVTGLLAVRNTNSGANMGVPFLGSLVGVSTGAIPTGSGDPVDYVKRFFSRLASGVRYCGYFVTRPVTIVTDLSSYMFDSIKTFGGTKIVVFGTPGTGKSSLCNVLFTGDPDHGEKVFIESPGTLSCTQDCQSEERFFLRNGSRPMKIMDTPGIGDIEGKNEELCKRFKEGLEKENNVHAFIWVKNSSCVRFDGQDQRLFKFMADVFGSEFMTHLIVIFSRFSHSSADIRRRSKTGQTQESLYRGFQDQLGMFADCDSVQQLFVVDIDAYFNPEDEHETTVFKENCEKLWGKIETLSLTPVERLEIVREKYHQVSIQIESLKDRMRNLSGAELEEANEQLKKLLILKRKYDEILTRSACVNFLLGLGKISLKTVLEEAAEEGFKRVVKATPVLGFFVGAAFGILRLKDGDYVGAVGEFASGAFACVPVVGNVFSGFVIDPALCAYDIYRGIKATQPKPKQKSKND